jgi:hypothetical protein
VADPDGLCGDLTSSGILLAGFVFDVQSCGHGCRVK